MIKLGVNGALGRVGRRIIALASQDKSFKVELALENEGHPELGVKINQDLKVSSDSQAICGIDVLIDFTIASAVDKTLEAVVKHKKALVLATTGLSESQIIKVEEAAKIIPIVFASNMSQGMNVLFCLLPKIAQKLGADYSIEIVEAHHDKKKDAPSGTAKTFVKLLKEATGKDIPTHSIRLGDISGDHTVIFCGNSERIEIRHLAHSKDLFALGALRAAKWVMGKPVGFYSMLDVLK